MPLYDLLLPEFDQEIQATRSTLERVPDLATDYKPHEKSRSFALLANHVAGMPGFLSLILTAPSFDLSKPSQQPAPKPTNAQERLASFDLAAATARAELAGTADRAMHENWKLSSGADTLYNGSRYHAVRSMFFNHLIHHRAQLGVYLRLNNLPVPATYGASADEE